MSSPDNPSWLNEQEDEELAKNAGDAVSATFMTEAGSDHSSDDVLAPPVVRKSGGVSMPSSSSTRKKVCPWILSLIPTACLTFFIAAAIVQSKIHESVHWSIFYAMHCVLPAMFLLHYYICWPTKVVYGYSVVMGVWSLIVLVMAGVNLTHAEMAIVNQTDGGDDEEERKIRRNMALEVAGCTIGLASALFHPLATRFTIKKQEPEVNRYEQERERERTRRQFGLR